MPSEQIKESIKTKSTEIHTRVESILAEISAGKKYAALLEFAPASDDMLNKNRINSTYATELRQYLANIQRFATIMAMDDTQVTQNSLVTLEGLYAELGTMETSLNKLPTVKKDEVAVDTGHDYDDYKQTFKTTYSHGDGREPTANQVQDQVKKAVHTSSNEEKPVPLAQKNKNLSKAVEQEIKKQPSPKISQLLKDLVKSILGERVMGFFSKKSQPVVEQKRDNLHSSTLKN
ncbi:MAG: hypothetical protein HKM04_05155 [Legionellales bacterium]|nr:hypothetical protein [Legionellales bacterium]